MDITSRRNEKAVHLKKLGVSREYREECGEFLCDGGKLLSEAAAHGGKVHDIFTCGEAPEDVPSGARVFTVTRDVLEAVSPLRSPQDVIFSAALPERDAGPVPPGAVLLENIQDPGNVGTMLRTANAFSAPAVVFVGACADPWGPKAVRASMGAVFRQRMIVTGLGELGKLAAGGFRILGAALGDGAEDIRAADLRGAAVAIGNEGNGLSGELLSICAGRIRIPMNGQCESLNAAAAAAVVMWEMFRRNG